MSSPGRWQDDAWAAARICSRTDRLSGSQIMAKRSVSQHSPDVIVERIGATVEQIRSVIRARLFTRQMSKQSLKVDAENIRRITFGRWHLLLPQWRPSTELTNTEA